MIVLIHTSTMFTCPCSRIGSRNCSKSRQVEGNHRLETRRWWRMLSLRNGDPEGLGSIFIHISSSRCQVGTVSGTSFVILRLTNESLVCATASRHIMALSEIFRLRRGCDNGSCWAKLSLILNKSHVTKLWTSKTTVSSTKYFSTTGKHLNHLIFKPNGGSSSIKPRSQYPP